MNPDRDTDSQRLASGFLSRAGFTGCTDLMRCFFFKGVLYGCTKTCQLKHQVLLAGVYRIKDCTCFKVAALFCKTVQNRFDTNDRIKDIRTCITFK